MLAEKKCVPCQGGGRALSEREAEDLQRKELPEWMVIDQAGAIERRFVFKNFAEALAFVNAVGVIAEEENHHPDISFGWGYCTILLQTHDIGGLHENDFIVAAKIDRVFAR